MTETITPTTNEARQPIPVDLQIMTYFHCSQCLAELPAMTTPREWAQFEVGFTRLGLQVWCRRHEVNVIHIDFEDADEEYDEHKTGGQCIGLVEPMG